MGLTVRCPNCKSAKIKGNKVIVWCPECLWLGLSTELEG